MQFATVFTERRCLAYSMTGGRITMMDEYVEMLIAAGWINAGDVDDEYEEYRKRAHAYLQDEVMSYDHWQYARQQLAELNAAYEVEIQPLYDANPDGYIGFRFKEREKELLRAIDSFQARLAY